MLDGIIKYSLRNRLLVLTTAVLLLGVGAWQAMQLTIDVFPNLNRPRVVVITEAPGMAPEEVESQITFPLETALNGASGVLAVRSSSSVGISVIYVEFDWDTDIYTDRQIVNERLALAATTMPAGAKTQLAPISSITGQILMFGMWSEDGRTNPMEIRTLADWVVRQRLLTIPGVAQVITIGGSRKQYQVLVDPQSLQTYGLTLHEVKRAVDNSNLNATGGYLDQVGPTELLVRGLGRATTIGDLRKVVVKTRQGQSISLDQVARVIEAPQVKRGDSSAFIKNGEAISGGPAVVLTINKQPDADTRAIADDVAAVLAGLRQSLPSDIRIAQVYSQRSFIDRAIDNVIEALTDGGVLVVVILFLFLLNFRTTFITLTAIPLSMVVTALVFAAFDLSINTMTLGGLAVAIGELVDDAIVDVENIFRRLKQNRLLDKPKATLMVVFQASREIRSSIVFGTIIVVLVFVPLFALSGMEGRLFAPMGAAYIVAILASLVVSLTVTPVLASLLMVGERGWRIAAPLLSLIISAFAFYWVLPRLGLTIPGHPAVWTIVAAPVCWILMQGLEAWFGGEDTGDPWLLAGLKQLAAVVIQVSTRVSLSVLGAAAVLVLLAVSILLNLERDFLPPFNEGSVQVNAILKPGTSLETSNQIGAAVEKRLLEIDSIRSLVRRTGRAELDEHAEGVHVSELVLELAPDAAREETLEEIRHTMADIKGVVSSVEQPLAHLISHMISGVKAQIGIKLYGDDLDTLRRTADEMKNAIATVDGVTDLFVEPQVIIPQLRIELDRDQLLLYGLQPAAVMEMLQTAMNGETVSQILVGQRAFDLVVRLDEHFRENVDELKRLAITLNDGSTIPLSAVARIYESGGPNTINREQVRRRIVLQANVIGRGVVDVVTDIQARLAEIELPQGYFVEYGGQFESQQSASRRLLLLSALALFAVFIVLFQLFGSINFALQVMVAIPTALVGAVAALVLTQQTLTVAAMVGFVSLCGIASRNGILLLNHYLHLVQFEGEQVTRQMVVRAGQERLAPVLMTALTSGIGLLPLALASGEAGKEILYPIATVIIGGLITSTIAEFMVRPALFWAVGRSAAQNIIDTRHERANETSPTL